ncbi:ATP-binding protein [Thiorhodococcus minor]|uniref:4Fe-4S dicluster domain-containing protein n=1 Tax=Thiorhodococcus minor TaxID=57489 RepID=A0A6M0K1Q7_9GAMM|nr:ATP-binding protein [Thiorhodococcus minor]NEV63670.1 4Fe-4S dicluster domain-containing protein [Thiorhodococcus minor]
MKELTILSGKGGTGKTTVSAAFASLASSKVMADCDVDASNLHLLLAPEPRQTADFTAMRSPRIDAELCAECGYCESWCRFDAIKLDFDDGYVIDALACEHCGLCALVCPESAILMEDHVCGAWMVSDTRKGTLVHARLGIGEDNSGKLVTLVRREARRAAQAEGVGLVLNDGPPGIGCPATAAITGTDLVLAVTEPTPSGIHDLERVAELCKHFKVPLAVCINKHDLDAEKSAAIRDWCQSSGADLLGEIPFDPAVTKALMAQRSVIDADCGPVVDAVTGLWEAVSARLGQLPGSP